MSTLEAVDAKIDRARSELRHLKADIAAFCEERARLILREDCGEQERWVYRGDAPKAPIQWSIRAGEFAYNLRSALDHLVWQLVLANAGCPSRDNQFPIQAYANQNNFKGNLRGVSPNAVEYIESVQPYHFSERQCQSDADRAGSGLAMLHDICNMDKHRHLAIANARWTGKRPKRRKLSEYEATGYVNCIGDGKPKELQHGQTLVITTGYKDWQYLEFPIDAFFDGLRVVGYPDAMPLSVSAALDACIDSVEIVVGHLRKEFH